MTPTRGADQGTETGLRSREPFRSAAESAGPIFVVGAPRSGTTLLRVILSSHSRLYIPPESDFIPRLFLRRARAPMTALSTSKGSRKSDDRLPTTRDRRPETRDSNLRAPVSSLNCEP